MKHVAALIALLVACPLSPRPRRVGTGPALHRPTAKSTGSHGGFFTGRPCWAQNGRYLAALIERAGGGGAVAVFERARGRIHLRRVARVSPWVRAVAWVAGTGEQVMLAAVRPPGPGSTERARGLIYMVEVRTGASRLVATGFEPCVSPDGRWVASLDAHQRLWFTRLASGRAVRVAGTGNTASGFVVERDGAWSVDGGAYAFLGGTVTGDYAVGVAFAAARRPTAKQVAGPFAYWVQLGNGWLGASVLFGEYGRFAGRRSAFRICSAPSHGGAVRVLVPAGSIPAPYGQAMWLRGGLVGYPTTRGATLYAIVSARSGHVRWVHVGGRSENTSFSFSPDARWLAVFGPKRASLLIADCSADRVRTRVPPPFTLAPRR